jgi:mitochondrial import receptor subunit TOM40
VPTAPDYLKKTATLTTKLQHQAKIGLGVSIEAAPEELQEQQEVLGAQPPPNIPF